MHRSTKVKVRRCVRVKRSHPVQASDTWGARVLMRIIDEPGPVTKAQVGCFVVAARRYSRMARAHSVSEHRRPVDNEVGLRCVRALWQSCAKVVRWHDMAVSHRRAHRQRCTRQANQRRAADGCPTCADDDKLGNDDYVMTCDITQMITDNKITFVKHFRCLWSLGFHTVRRSQQASASGATHKLAHRHDMLSVTCDRVWLCRVVRASPHSCPVRVARTVAP
jgi:hypothetical protein